VSVTNRRAGAAAEGRRERAAAAASSLARELPLVLLGIAVAASIVLLLSYGSGLNFFQDEWDFLLHRRGLNLHAFLAPDNEHISVFTAAVFKFFESTFGMTSTMPYRVVATILLAATAVLLFVFLRSLIGNWLALLGAIMVLFLGPAWQTLLLPVEMARVASLAAGIGVLLALRRRDRFGDRLACVLLTASVLCFSLGVAFIAAAAVDVALRRRSWRQRLFIPTVPLAIYLLWYATYGHEATGNVSLHNLATSPIYLVKALASALQALLGAWPTQTLQPDHPTWGWVLLGVTVAAVAIRLRQSRVVGAQLWPVAAAAAASWLLAAATYLPGREATSSRFQYTSVVFVLLVLAELFPGIRITRFRLGAATAVAALALAANISTLTRGRDFLRVQSGLSRADLGALELARRTVDPTLRLTPDIAGTQLLVVVDAGSYLSAVDAYGSPADSPSKLAAAPGVDRAWADVVLGHALPVTLDDLHGSHAGAAARVHCETLPAGSDALRDGAALRPGRTLIRVAPGEAATVRLRRFASGSFPFTVGSVPGGTAAALAIPADRSPRPWHIRVEATQTVTLCERRA
jgi:hypothetical protein